MQRVLRRSGKEVKKTRRGEARVRFGNGTRSCILDTGAMGESGTVDGGKQYVIIK